MKSLIVTVVLIIVVPLVSIGQLVPNTPLQNATTPSKNKKKKLPNYMQRAIYDDERKGLNAPNAPINYAAYIYKKREELRRTTIGSDSRSNSGEWQSDGPMHLGAYTSIGRVNRIAFHPTDPDIIYAASAGGGLWYTSNHGLFWRTLSDHLPVNNTSDVVIDPVDTDILYLLTGDGDGRGGADSSYGLSKFSIGVLKSTDHGGSWARTGLQFDETSRVSGFNLDMHPTDNNVLFCSTSMGIFRSSDAGITWDTTLQAGQIYEVKFHPTNSDIIYAVSNTFLFRSEDGGLTWPILTGIPAHYGTTSRMTMATCQNDPDRLWLYAAPQHDSIPTHRGLFVSDTQGSFFTRVDSTSNITSADQGSYDIAAVCNPLDSDELLYAKVNLAKTSDGGTTASTSIGIHADHHHLTINPLMPSRVYGANDGGIYYSDNFGESNSWVFISETLRITQYYRISVGQTNEHFVIGGSQDNGTHRNVDNNAVFDRIHHSDGMDNAIHPLDDNLVVVSTQSGNFSISTSGGGSLSPLIGQDDLPDGVDTDWVTPFEWDPNNSDNMMVGYKPIYRSNDGGSTFSSIPDTVGGGTFLHISKADVSRIYASDRYPEVGDTAEYHIHTSDDAGTSWLPIHYTMPESTWSIRKSDVSVNPSNALDVWVTLSGFNDTLKVYRSIDAGKIWVNVSGSLPNIPIHCIVHQEGGPTDAVYIGTDLGVFYRDNSLGDWVHFSNGLPAVEVTDLEIQYNSQTLYAATYGRGIWTSELYTDCPPYYALNSATLLPQQDYFFQSSNHIELNDYTIESLGANMRLRAENLILIESGFVMKTDNESVFTAKLGPCGGGIED